MKVSLGKKNYFYPLPVLIIASYDKDHNPNAMNAAWGGVIDYNKIKVYLTDDHQTSYNIHEKRCFTLSFATKELVKESDYLGIVSGKNVKDKLAKCGLTTSKSELIDAPIINEYPLTLECKVTKIDYTEGGMDVEAEVINCLLEEAYMNEKKLPDLDKLNLISYDTANHEYVVIKGIAGKAFSDGKFYK